jgi:hypothetical protein
MASPEPTLNAAQQTAYGKIADQLEAAGYGPGDGCNYQLVEDSAGVWLEQRCPDGTFKSYLLA